MINKQDITNTIAHNVRSIMNEKGLTSPELAKRCKVSSGMISKIINANTGITIAMAMNLAEGLGVNVNEIFRGLISTKQIPQTTTAEPISIGILSISNKRLTCIKNRSGRVLGTSELTDDLDLAKPLSDLMHLIQQSIQSALPTQENLTQQLKNAHLKLVMQSYEFEETRNKFELLAKKYFKNVTILPDWQITYFSDCTDSNALSLVVDKGVSLSYMHNGMLKKLGGWKFPVYDLGGENWLGNETVRHTIDAFEGFIPMSKLANDVLVKFNNKLEVITEICFKGTRDPDIYCLFSNILLRNYLAGDPAAKSILKNGFELVYKLVERANTILGKKSKLTLNGSLSDIYKPFFKKETLIQAIPDTQKVSLLADITKAFLSKYGIK